MTHEELVDAVESELRSRGMLAEEADARAVIALIAEATKESTRPMNERGYSRVSYDDDPDDIWSAMHRASALWPEEGPP